MLLSDVLLSGPCIRNAKQDGQDEHKPDDFQRSGNGRIEEKSRDESACPYQKSYHPIKRHVAISISICVF
jgi:hypothetical protein